MALSNAERQRRWRERRRAKKNGDPPPEYPDGAAPAPKPTGRPRKPKSAGRHARFDAAGVERTGDSAIQDTLELAARSLADANAAGATLPPDVAARLVMDYHKLKATNARLKRTPTAPKPAAGNAKDEVVH